MYELPVIYSAGTFDSSSKFLSITKTPERAVTEYELELYSHDGGISILNGREYPIRHGMILLSCPGDRRSSTLPFQNCFIRLSQMDDAMDKLFRGVAGVTLLEDCTAFRSLFERITEWFLSDDPYCRTAAAAEIYQLIRMIHTQRLQHTSAEPREGDVVQRAQDYIEAHYQEPFGVEDLASACHVSAPYLHRLFVNHLNITPHTALVRRRLIAAKMMLINESDSISDVAWKCGFQSASYFSDCFRRHVGMSPRKFRKETGYQL